MATPLRRALLLGGFESCDNFGLGKSGDVADADRLGERAVFHSALDGRPVDLKDVGDLLVGQEHFNRRGMRLDAFHCVAFLQAVHNGNRDPRKMGSREKSLPISCPIPAH